MKHAKQQRVSPGSVSDHLVKEVAARIEQYGQVLRLSQLPSAFLPSVPQCLAACSKQQAWYLHLSLKHKDVRRRNDSLSGSRQNNDYRNVEDVEDYLRRAYPAYSRRPQAQFRQVVERAINRVQRRGGPKKPELRLQARNGIFSPSTRFSAAVVRTKTRCRVWKSNI